MYRKTYDENEQLHGLIIEITNGLFTKNIYFNALKLGNLNLIKWWISKQLPTELLDDEVDEFIKKFKELPPVYIEYKSIEYST